MNKSLETASNRQTTGIQHYYIGFCLESDTTFGRGDGIAGLIDREVEHDELGLPFLRGRTLKGLLNEECANILYALDQIFSGDHSLMNRWRSSAARLFGAPGSDTNSSAWLRFGNAHLPESVRSVVAYEVAGHSTKRVEQRLTAEDFLQSLTAVRRQTSLDEMGVPVEGSLRAMRVILRQTPFEAELLYTLRSKLDDADSVQADDLALLAACVKAWRRVGTGRNRGRGKLTATLYDYQRNDILGTSFARFAESIQQTKEVA